MLPLEMCWDGEGHSLKLIEEPKQSPHEKRMQILEKALAQETPESLMEKLESYGPCIEIPDICYQVAHWWDNRKIQRRIVCAANRFELKSGGHLVIPGVRHYSPDMAKVLDQLEDKLVTDHVHGDNQGFVDQWGNYFTREEALIIATHAEQINTVREKTAPYDELFSEDLY